MLMSCSLSNNEHNIAQSEDFKENLRIYLKNNYDNKLNDVHGITLTYPKLIQELYDEIEFSSIWIDDSLQGNNDAQKFLSVLSSSRYYGLDSNKYNSEKLIELFQQIKNNADIKDRYHQSAELEILLTNSYFLFAKDIYFGITPIDSNLLVSELPRKKFEVNLVKHLLESLKTDSLCEILLSLQPNQKEYIELQKKATIYLKTVAINDNQVKVIHFREDSILAYKQSKEALKLHGYLTNDSIDSVYFNALKKFQIEHGLLPDGLVGRNTAKALSQSTFYYYKKIAINLEKWRWKEAWPEDFIYVNIPSYQMKVYLKNKLKQTHNVVVGTTKTPTSEIIDEMDYMIVYPYWNLPYSISSEELLPKIKKDSTYLKRNGYEVFTTKHKPVDSDNINWSTVTKDNFNYKIRQQGGGSNSLGVIKFIFPNKHSIYFHDTPSKSFFRNELRAYSHGCVRVQNPTMLAGIILENDNHEYNLDSVNALISRKEQKRITLNKKLPVYIQYFTCGIDSSENLVFYPDIYGLDNKLEELMGLNYKPKEDSKGELASK